MRCSREWNVLVACMALLLPVAACSRPASTQPSESVPSLPPEHVGAPEAAAPELLSVERATVVMEGSTVVMEGGLDDGFYERFLSLVRGQDHEVTTLRVNSGGGFAHEGIKLGTWIIENDVDVVVDGLCFSSCANYIFTAGRNKTILADSMVGWHGSVQQDEHMARGLGMTIEEILGSGYDEHAAKRGDTPSPEGRELFVEEFLAWRPAIVAEEQAFLEKVGVSVDALVYGLLPDQFDDFVAGGSAQIGGWTFSPNDMAGFGIDNVTYAGDGDYPSERAVAEYLVRVFEVP